MSFSSILSLHWINGPIFRFSLILIIYLKIRPFVPSSFLGTIVDFVGLPDPDLTFDPRILVL